MASFDYFGQTWGYGDLDAFKAALGAHGDSYATWADNHPAAAQILEYNPYAYVPGGSSQVVAAAIVAAAAVQPPPPPEPDPAPPPPEPDPAPPAPDVPYNPEGYVPGGSSAAVGQAIEAQAIATPGPTPVEVPASIEAAIPPDTLVTTPTGTPETFVQSQTLGPPAPVAPVLPPSILPSGNFNHDELEALWVKAGGAVAHADVAAAIALAESGGDPGAINNSAYPNLPGYHEPAKGDGIEYSVGLWQINTVAHPSDTASDMLVPLYNAQAAIAISGNGTDFGAWSTYTSGAYKSHLTGSEPVIAPADSAPAAETPPGVGAAWTRLMTTMDDGISDAATSAGALADNLSNIFV